MTDKKLAPNFFLHEVVCPCCDKGDGIIYLSLVMGLQKLRDLINANRTPDTKEIGVTILSGYRCLKHNAEIRKQPLSPQDERLALTSKHLIGLAADITCKGLTPLQMYLMAEEVPAFRNGGIGISPSNNMIHVDVRGMWARWVCDGDNYISLPKWIMSGGLI